MIMRSVIYVAAFLVLTACGNSEHKKVEERVEIRAYGPGKVDMDKAISVEQLFSAFKPEKGEQEFTFTGELTEVCSTAGCWVKVDRGGGESLRVRFKDHFTIPTKTKPGTKAYIHGIAYMDTIPVDLQQHFARDDERKSEKEVAKITEPAYEFSFEADAILFKKESRKVTVD